MNENLKVWRQVDRPPTTALKKIGGGRLAGKSDINPQWRIQAMTETFGMCGVGWKYTIDKLWTEPGDNGEVFAFASVSVFFYDGENTPTGWSDPIPATGGSMLVQREKSGLYNNDEAFKMATTDALGTAMKMLGVAADIYLGNFDGSKYKDRPADRVPPKPVDPSLRSKGLPILEGAAQQGMKAFAAAWELMPKEMRLACQEDKDRLKLQIEQETANDK